MCGESDWGYNKVMSYPQLLAFNMNYNEIIKILKELLYDLNGEGLFDVYEHSQHIGVNSFQESIFSKIGHPIEGLNQEYLNHIRSHAANTLTEPAYYKDLFIIQN